MHFSEPKLNNFISEVRVEPQTSHPARESGTVQLQGNFYEEL